MKFSVYFDNQYVQLSDNWLSFLAPLLGRSNQPIRWEDIQQVQEREILWKKILNRVSTIDQADAVVFPMYFQLEYFDMLKNIAKEAQQYKKYVIAFYTSDVDDYIDVAANIMRFKRSLHKDGPDNEISLPAFPQDIGDRQLETLPLSNTITVGYVGYSNYYDIWSFMKFLFLQLGYWVFHSQYIRKILLLFKKEKLYHLLTTLGRGKYVRGKVINALKSSKRIQFNYTERKWWLYMDASSKLRQEYITNLQDSLFALVMRWNGNYSFRFYEVFSIGKIPIIIDTNTKLPFADKIQYNTIAVIVPFDDVSNIENYIIDFYEKNKEKLSIIQKEIRRIYEEYFVMHNCYKFLIWIHRKKHE